MAYSSPNVPDNSSGSKERTSLSVLEASTSVPPRSNPYAPNAAKERTKAPFSDTFIETSIKNARNSYQKTLDDLKKKYDEIQASIKDLTKKRQTAIQGGYTTQAASLQKKIETANQDLIAVQKQMATVRSTLRATPYANEAPATPAPGKGPNQGQVQTPPTDNTAAINLSACKELYFRGTEKFIFDVKDVAANAPGFVPSLSPVTSFKNAEELWKRGIATKGRIQTFSPFTGNKNPSTLGGRNLEEFAAKKALGRKAFQFHYNPGSVDMSYGSVNDVDLGYLASGQAVTNFLQALGQVSFEILLNRMPDMKFIDPSSSNYQKTGVNYVRDVYDRSPRVASNQSNELKDIYNKGTMYDLEFLLRVLMGGVSFTSLLRGGEITSDLGFAIPQPVELHLGNRLRYVISVTNLNVRHVIFNERMVPLFSTVSITANRVPADTISVTNLDLGGGAATTTTDVFSPTSNPTVNSHLRDLQGR